MKLQVLVSTMNQLDDSLAVKMRISSDAVIINQCESNSIRVFKLDDYTIKLVSVAERGVSRSRNLAVNNATADICLLSDDDVTYEDGYSDIICDAFRQIESADIIAFNINRTNYNERTVSSKRITVPRNAPKYKYFGAVRIAFRLKSVRESGILFNENFGPGSVYGAGEDAIFLRDARKNGLVVYEHPSVIASVDFSKSSWFRGYNEKYFYDKGAFLAAAHEGAKNIFKYYYILRLFRHSSLSITKILKLLNAGTKGYKSIMSYDEYAEVMCKRTSSAS